MNQPDIEAFSFKVHGTNGIVDTYLKGEIKQFLWVVGRSGELTIFKKEFHPVFSNTVLKDARYKCYAPGTWTEVTVLEEDEDKRTEWEKRADEEAEASRPTMNNKEVP